jgi:hypothetical protein
VRAVLQQVPPPDRPGNRLDHDIVDPSAGCPPGLDLWLNRIDSAMSGKVPLIPRSRPDRGHRGGSQAGQRQPSTGPLVASPGSMPKRHFSRSTKGSLHGAQAKLRKSINHSGLPANGCLSVERMGDPSGSFTADTRADKVMPAIRRRGIATNRRSAICTPIFASC